jgi:hypothetical protein
LSTNVYVMHIKHSSKPTQWVWIIKIS